MRGDLIEKHEIAGKRLLLLRADIARPALPKLLMRAGADVTERVMYQTQLAAGLPDDVLTALRDHAVDWITFTSSSTAVNMIELLGHERDLLNHVKIASIGPITSRTLGELAVPVTIEADPYNISGLVAAICSCGSSHAK